MIDYAGPSIRPFPQALAATLGLSDDPPFTWTITPWTGCYVDRSSTPMGYPQIHPHFVVTLQ